ncbi:sodium-dependent transporter [Candidatus Berkiella cookevillensis]|uniref:Transporter n=1 Tax=Candidatus Berkiella cookevillensis TaxID=437022 RepID=A0A0Q9YHS9_9GAMM|nr:sodium-dependent transporter [Candidatus Berkiella cookevillensis]MCS5708294.1 sodium-dependent transporter [Candidatus Berkiella cookevillensis]
MASQSSSGTVRSVWSSRLAFILVSAGAAVGLGNIWRFPYMAGENGGGVFVLTYILFLFAIGTPAMIAELMIGRRGQKNPVDTLETLAHESNESRNWKYLGWLGALTLVMVLSFYSVISGFAIGYLNYAIQGTFNNASPDAISALWINLMNQPILLIGWHTIFMVLTMGVVALGVNQGIEKSSRWMMPALFIILIVLVIYAAIIGNFKEAFVFLFSFKIQDFTPMAIVGALGQSFFSLATGAGAILIYGSYLSKNTNMFSTVFIIAILDLFVAILSGLAIFPIVFAHGLSPADGPSLMFKVLPIAFSNMPGAQFVGICFFLLLIFAAWTSSISMGEPLVSLIVEKTKIKRTQASIYVGLLAWGFGIISALSFSIWRGVEIFEWRLFEVLLGIPTNILLPIGALLFCIFAGWVMKEKHVEEELNCSSPALYFAWRFAIRYLCPLCILIILITTLV